MDVAEIIPLQDYIANFTQIKLRSSINWVISKAYTKLPPDLEEPFELDDHGSYSIKQNVVKQLVNSNLYKRCCVNIFCNRLEDYQSQGHSSVFQILSRNGFYVVAPNDSDVTDSILSQAAPFKVSAHIAMIDSLMMAYATEKATIENVTNCINNLKTELFDVEDALFLWINSIGLSLKEKIGYSDENLLVVKHLDDISDGCNLVAIINHYEVNFKLQDAVIRSSLDISDSLYNLELALNYIEKTLGRIAINSNDLLYCEAFMKPNIIVFLAELFNYYENTKKKSIKSENKRVELADINIVNKEKKMFTLDCKSIEENKSSDSSDSEEYKTPSNEMPPTFGFDALEKRSENLHNFLQQSWLNKENNSITSNTQTDDAKVKRSKEIAPQKTNNREVLPMKVEKQVIVNSNYNEKIELSDIKLKMEQRRKQIEMSRMKNQSKITNIYQQIGDAALKHVIDSNNTSFKEKDTKPFNLSMEDSLMCQDSNSLPIIQKPVNDYSLSLEKLNSSLGELHDEIMNLSLENLTQSKFKTSFNSPLSVSNEIVLPKAASVENLMTADKVNQELREGTSEVKATEIINIDKVPETMNKVRDSKTVNKADDIPEVQNTGFFICLTDADVKKKPRLRSNKPVAKVDNSNKDNVNKREDIKENVEILETSNDNGCGGDTPKIPTIDNNKQAAEPIVFTVSESSSLSIEELEKRRLKLLNLREKRRLKEAEKQSELENERQRKAIEQQKKNDELLEKREKEKQKRAERFADYLKQKRNKDMKEKSRSSRKIHDKGGLNKDEAKLNRQFSPSMPALNFNGCKHIIKPPISPVKLEQIANNRGRTNSEATTSIDQPEYTGPKLFVQPSAKSNKTIILNAIKNCCLAGNVNAEKKVNALKALAISQSNHYIILFRGAGQQFRSLNTFDPDTEEILKIYGVGPSPVTNKMMEGFYKYYSGGKCFTKIESTKHISVSIDAITIHNQYWQKRNSSSTRS